MSIKKSQAILKYFIDLKNNVWLTLGSDRGGALGHFLGGYVAPGTPSWRPVLNKISPKIDTPF